MSWDLRTPFARGQADGFAGKPGPDYPKASSSWEEKMFYRGWESGLVKRAIAAALGQPIEVQP